MIFYPSDIFCKTRNTSIRLYTHCLFVPTTAPAAIETFAKHITNFLYVCLKALTDIQNYQPVDINQFLRFFRERHF